MSRPSFRPLAAALVLLLLAACGGGDADRTPAGDSAATPVARTQRERDSAIGVSGLPNAAAIGRAQRAADSAGARATATDSAGTTP